MSTKTTFKRIALVAVASLGFGLMTAIPSNAAYNVLACTTAGSGAGGSSVACGQNSGVNNYVVLTTSADIYATITGGTFAGGATSKVLSAGTVNVPTPTAGTITVSGYTFANGAQSATVTDTVTITVTDAAAAALAASRANGTYWDHSKGYISTTTGATATADTASIVSTKAASATAVARISVHQFSSTDDTIWVQNGTAKLVTVAVVGGAGYVSTASNGTLAGPSASLTGLAIADFYVYPNGNSGVASVTISVNGALVSTKSVTFYGSAATVSAAVATTVLKVGSNGAAVKATVLDSLGNPVPNVPLFLVSGTTATVVTGAGLGSTGADGTLTAAISGAAVGTSSLKISTDAAAADGSITSAATSVRVSDSTPTAVALSFDKASYLPGEAAVITATITNAAGAVPAGLYTVLAGPASSSLVMTSGSLPAAAITTTGNAGTATFNVNMPLSAGSVTVSGTGAAGVTVTGATVDVTGGVAQDAVDAANDATDAANAALDAANAAADAADAATAAAQDAGDMAVAAAEAAGEIAQAAADAAVEATDAANAATDAANAAAEAADAATDAANSAAEAAQAATDAVAALSTQVASLIAGLKAQLTALTNLVIKIQKKVKA